MMKNRSFFILLAVAAVMVFGVMAENTRSVLNPDAPESSTDADEARKKIRDAGLIPRDAMHWKEL